MFADYVLANPSGSVVALVTAPVAAADRARVVSEIFDNEPTCEQVGFVEFLDENSISLDVMGGEFGGDAAVSAEMGAAASVAVRETENAVASAAAYLAEAYNMPVYEDMFVNVYVPGAEQPLSVQVLRKKDSVGFCGEVADGQHGDLGADVENLATERHNFTCIASLPLADGGSEKIKVEVVI